MPSPIAGFKAYDVRGRIPDELKDAGLSSRRAYAAFVKPKRSRSGATSVSRARSLRGADARADRCGRRRGRHRPVRHRGRVLRHLRRRARRRHHGDREPQSARLQRHEVRARAEPADQRRYRPEGHAGADRARAAAGARPPRPGQVRSLDISAKYLRHLLGYVDARPAQARSRSSSMPATAAPD